MSDPTTLRKFYYKGERRSGRSNIKSSKGGSMLGGDALQQGIEVRSVQQSRGLLPVFSGEGRYKTITQYRIASGDRKRVVYATEDSKENNYFLDNDNLVKSSYLITSSSAAEELRTWAIFPDEIITDSELISLLNSEAIEVTNSELFNLDRPEGRSSNGNLIKFIKFTRSAEPPKAKITFPDGGILQVPDYSINTVTYGCGREYLSNTPFTELGIYDPIAFVNESAPIGMFPEISKSTSYTLDSIYDGVIEPFEIRQKLYGKSTFENGEGEQVNSDLPENSFILHHIAVNSRIPEVSGGWFEDVGGTNPEFHTTVEGRGIPTDLGYIPPTAISSIDNPAYVTETDYYFAPYLEKDPLNESIKSPLSNVFVDDEIEAQLLKMNPGLDQNSLPAIHVDMAVGHTARALDRFGSLVYRDMLR